MNCDAAISAADVVLLINKAFLGTGSFCDNPAIKGDLNCDGFRDGTDCWLLLNCVFQFGNFPCPGSRPTIPAPQDSIIMESKMIRSDTAGSPAMLVRIWITNKDTLTHISFPYEERSISGGAYIIASRPRTFNGTVIRLTATLGSLLTANYGGYNSSSPDSVVLGAFEDGFLSNIEPPNSTRKAFWDLKFDSINAPAGTVELDTIRILDNTVHFVKVNGTRVPVNFVKSTITVTNVKPNWAPIGEKFGTVGQPQVFNVAATDPNLTIPLLAIGPPSLPVGASFNDFGTGTGQFSWTPAAYQVGVHHVDFIASDGFLADTQSVTFTVLADTLKSQKNGDNPGDQFGFAIAGGGDVDGDGVADYIIGAPGTDVTVFGEGTELTDAGSAYVFSGKNDTLIYQVNGTAAGERVGGSVGLYGDVDLDGTDDFVVGAPGANDSAGKAIVYSGATGLPLFTITGSNPGERVGGSVGISGDVNSDGHTDFIVGAPGVNDSAGAAYVYSGIDGSFLYQKIGSTPGDRVGGSVGIYGVYAIIGAPGANNSTGTVFVDSGATGVQVFQKSGSSPGDRVGGSVGIYTDDFIVGAPGANSSAGSAFVYSLSDGSLSFQVNGTSPGDRVGGSVGISADVNRDGFNDFIVGAPGVNDSAGAVYVYSGQNGSLLFQKTGDSTGERVGGSVGIFANDNGSEPRILFGAPGADPSGNQDAGSAFIFQTEMKGDLNGDKLLTSADVVHLLNCTFLGSSIGVDCTNLSVADIDCNSFLTAADVVKELNLVFLGIPSNCSL